MHTIGYSLVAVLFLLAANAFFVAAEFALVKVRRFQLNEALADGRHAAALSIRMHRNLDAYLAACQLGITMASLGLGWVGEPAVAALLEPTLSRFGVSEQSLHTISFLAGFLLFSSLHIVIGEQVPKTYAIRKAQPVTLYLAYPLLWFYWLVFPLNWLLDRANAGILKLIGVAEAPHHEIISEDEISSIVDNSEAHGEIEEQTADIIRKAFRFDDQTVHEVMVPWTNVATLNLSADQSATKTIILETQHSRFPVIDAVGDVVGILATKDLIAALLGEEKDIWKSMESRVRPPLVVPKSLLISSLLEMIRSTRTRLAIVIDEHGNYIGIVSLEDMLEEIVGEIEDEWDTEQVEAPIVETATGWNVSGQVSLKQVESVLKRNLAPQSGVTTLGGWVMDRLGHLPKEGDQFEDADHKFIVTKMNGRRVDKVTISHV
ncbi:MAG: hemolysin family protein [Gammaproteobacteria bacterium]|nr:hemolysin family protein [Gammaproteobacteria bacterium]